MVGENLAGQPGGVYLTFSDATQLWFDEIWNYSGEPLTSTLQGRGGVYGHYTQVCYPYCHFAVSTASKSKSLYVYTQQANIKMI